jgi:CRP/FNR family cyclic AMP-dependent transcriptional regulator
MSEKDQLFARYGRSCAPGTLLFREGDEGNTMYVLQAGRVRISKESEDGVRTLAVLGPGDFFGEMAILNRKPRTATAEVVEQAQLLVLDAKTFESMVLSNAEIAVRLIQKLARRLDNADTLIEILLHRDPKARVILGLSREAEHAGVEQPDGSVLVPLTRDGLATQVGLGVEAVVEVLARLTRLRIVRETPEGFVIEDVLRLSEFLEFLQMREKFADA